MVARFNYIFIFHGNLLAAHLNSYSWTRYVKSILREFLHFWHKHRVGHEDKLIRISWLKVKIPARIYTLCSTQMSNRKKFWSVKMSHNSRVKHFSDHYSKPKLSRRSGMNVNSSSASLAETYNREEVILLRFYFHFGLTELATSCQPAALQI